MELQTLRFGKLWVSEDQVITIPRGLLGFEEVKRYVIVEDRCRGPFKWLQAIDESALAFIIVDPHIFCPQYRVELLETDLEELRLEDPALAQVYAIVVIPERIEDMSANLKGPVVVNPETRLAKQVVLTGQGYSTHYPILQELTHLVGEQA